MKSLLNPSDGSAIAHVVLTNKPEYMESRAVEMIHDAQRVSDIDAYRDLISKAITLLACAATKRGLDER